MSLEGNGDNSATATWLQAGAVEDCGRRLALLEMAQDLGQLELLVRGDCMVPLIVEGDRLVVEQEKRYWPGDVVAFFAHDGRFLVHRVIGYRPVGGRLGVVTAADRAPGWDDPVPVGGVLGRVASISRDGEPAALEVSLSRRVLAASTFVSVAVSRTLRRLFPSSDAKVGSDIEGQR